MAAASSSSAAAGRIVCVTGASGFIASHVCNELLKRGYTVHGTVRSLARPEKVDHLKALPGASERLKLFEADLMKEGSFDAAIAGCEGVFHTASPFFVSVPPEDPEKELLQPAREGTLNVLRSAQRASVKGVIVTSSMAAVLGKEAPDDHVWSEKDWSDPERLRAKKSWYSCSKTVAELAAWDFHEEQKEPFHMAVVNPTLVVGPMLQPTMNESSSFLANFVTGKRNAVPNDFMSFVDVRDTAVAHVLMYEKLPATAGTKATALASGTGRLVTVSSSIHWATALKAFGDALPSDLAARLPKPEGDLDDEPTLYDNTRANKMLGLDWMSSEQSIADLARNEHFLKLVREQLAASTSSSA